MINKELQQELKEFGIVIGTAFCFFAFFIFYKGHSYGLEVLLLGLTLLISGQIVPETLLYIYKPWMWLAEKMGLVMTKIILSLLFFGLILTISLLGKMFGETFLNLNQESKKSYWQIRKKISKTKMKYFFEKQF